MYVNRTISLLEFEATVMVCNEKVSKQIVRLRFYQSALQCVCMESNREKKLLFFFFLFQMVDSVWTWGLVDLIWESKLMRFLHVHTSLVISCTHELSDRISSRH